MKFLFSLLIAMTAHAEVSKEVIIRGKIGNAFDDKEVKIIDSMGQIYMVPRKLFPKDKVIKTGEAFYLEVDEKELQGLKLLKK